MGIEIERACSCPCLNKVTYFYSCPGYSQPDRERILEMGEDGRNEWWMVDWLMLGLARRVYSRKRYFFRARLGD